MIKGINAISAIISSLVLRDWFLKPFCVSIRKPLNHSFDDNAILKPISFADLLGFQILIIVGIVPDIMLRKDMRPKVPKSGSIEDSS